MAIIRELTTVLDFKTDEAGLNRYEASVKRVGEITKGVLGALGITLAIEKVIEFVDGLVDAAKEVRRLEAQLKVIARPMDDMNQAQEDVFNMAQNLGLEYKEILSTFKEMYNELRDTTAPVSEIEAATENIYKGLRVGRASAEEMHQTMELLNRSFRRGSLRSMSIGTLRDIAPRVFDILGEQLGGKDRAKWEDNLRAMGKSGKLTAEVVLAAFAKANKQLDDEFAAVPQKLGWVFTKIYNDLLKLTKATYSLIDSSQALGRTIWWVYSGFRNFVMRVTEAVGGLKNVVEILGIAIATYLIRNLLLLNVRTWAMVAANLALIATYAAMALAVIAVAVAIQDLVYWFQGKPSLIATWVGPFKDLKDNFAKLDIFAGPRIFQDLLSGDFKKAWEDLKLVFSEVDAGMLAILATATLVKAAFMGWNVLKFTGLIAAIEALDTAMKGTLLMTLTRIVGALMFIMATGPAGGEDPKFSAEKNDEFRRNRGDPNTGLSGWIRRNFPSLVPDIPGQPTPGLPGLPALGLPGVPQGALFPGSVPTVVSPEQTNTVNQTNNVTVNGVTETAIADQIDRVMRQSGEQLLNGLSREVASSAPRIEAATR